MSKGNKQKKKKAVPGKPRNTGGSALSMMPAAPAYAMCMLIFAVLFCDIASDGMAEAQYAVFPEIFQQIIANCLFRAGKPIVSVNHIIRLQFPQYILVHDSVLHHHMIRKSGLLYQFHSFFQRNGRKSVKPKHSLVCQNTHRHFSIGLGFS